MHAYAEILDPSVVSHALFVALAGEPCLVLVRGASLLQVYTHLADPRGPRWLAEFPLDGTVTQLTTLSGADVAVAFRSAKLVLLEWDAAAVAFAPRSLHLYERLLDAGDAGTGAQDAPLLSVDATKGTLVFRFQRDLAVLIARCGVTNPLFPETAAASGELESTELPLVPLVPDAACAEVVDVALLPVYTLPTVAVLYWTESTWAGLVPKHGDRTKALTLVSLPTGALASRARAAADTLAASGVVLTVKDIQSDVFKVVPVHTRGTLVLLIGSSSLSFVDDAGLLVPIDLDASDRRLRFENCQAAELPNTEWVIIALASGAVLAVNMRIHRLQHLKPAGFVPEPTCLSASADHTLVIGSRLGACALCRADLRTATQPVVETTAEFSVRAFYDKLVAAPREQATLCGLTNLFSFANVGALIAVTPIDDGIAAASGDSVVIVERELPLVEHERVEAGVDLGPGRFWILSDSKPGSKLLLASSKTLEHLELEAEKASGSAPSKKKRRNTRQARESTLFYDDELAPSRDTAKPKQRRRPKQIRAFATDQATLAVHEGSEVVVVVQTRSLSAYETGSWKFLSAAPIPTAYFAEIQDGLVVLQHREGKEARVYSSTDLALVKTVTNVDHAAVCSKFLLTAVKSWINISSPTSPDKGKFYDLTRLDRVVEPSDSMGEEGFDLIAIFALEFSGTHYIGVHLNRLFCIYEPIGSSLLKRFTVPFMVNQSPVWLSASQLLVFLGPQTHVLVKSRESKFACHLLQTDGLHSLDVIAYSERAVKVSSKEDEKGRHGTTKPLLPTFAWLDDRKRLHFSCIDPDVDYLSNKLPYRRILVDSGISIQDLAYHDDTQSLVVGANRSVKYEEPKAVEEDVEMTDDHEDADDAGDSGNADDAANAGLENGGADKVESVQPSGDHEDYPPPQAFTGCVLMLQLSNYKAFEVPTITFERYETLVSLACVDHCDAGGRQLVAVGTAVMTEEDRQCNGHIYLYRVDEPRAPADDDDQAERQHKLSLHLFAKDYLRGAVSSIVEMMGFLAVAHGQQVRVYNFHKELEPVGFFDTEVYMKDMKAVRNLLLLGEECRGPRLVNFGLQPHRMDLLCSSEAGKPPAPLTSIEGVSSAYKGDLCIVSCDAAGRLQVLQYDPENSESAGGTRFVPLASFHTGRECLGFAAVKLANDDLIAYGVTQDGVLFSVTPITEEVFRTLFVLTQQMMDKEQSVAALNPRAHRQMLATPANHVHHLIDFNYAQRLWNLPVDRQVMYSRKLGYNGLSRAHRALNSFGRDSLKL